MLIGVETAWEEEEVETAAAATNWRAAMVAVVPGL